MSIYFQYPAINEYPNLTYAVQTVDVDFKIIMDEDSINREEIVELKDFLALKPI